MKCLIKLGLEVVVIMGILSSLFGPKASPKPQSIEEARSMLPAAYENTAKELPGKLVGVRNEHSSGSMVYGSEFYITVTPQEVTECGFYDFDNYAGHEMIRKEHLGVPSGLWSDLSDTICNIYEEGCFKEIEKVEKVEPKLPSDDYFVLDGGSYDRWWLTWETESGTVELRYYSPSDRRILTINDILEELANPRGREIRHYESPVLCGAYYRNDYTDTSFQCTIFDHNPNDYYFIPRFPALEINYSKHLSPDAWEQAKPAFAWINPESFKRGTTDSAITVSLYYSDGTQIRLEFDKANASLIENYLGFVAQAYK